ncbi:MAG: 1,4-alpha-glucan branching protein domain-containing protein [Anaerolineae bacterium]
MTIGFTPVLVEQLADPLVLEHLEMYLDEKIAAAKGDVERFRKEGQPHLEYLAGFYQNWYQHALDTLRDRFGRDIVGAFRRLQDEGYIEIVTSAATHGYLPLLERDSSIYGQLAVGVASYQRHFGCAPRAVWLPECAYRPAFYAQADGERYYKPGLEEFLAELRLGCFFAETHTIEGGDPVGKAREGVIGPYGDIPKRYVVPLAGYVEPTERTTYQPYWVGGAEVAAMGRNNRTGMQVWSADWGYPGDFDYREFHKKDGISGLQYWRVTGAHLDLAYKDYYHPDWAQYKVGEHARHFTWLVEDLLREYHGRSGKYGIIASNYDTELFGHWWFEGVDWIKAVLRRLSQSEVAELTTASDFLEEHPPEDVLALPESSWGTGGGHFTWDNVDTRWMWPIIHQAERRMEALVDQHPDAQGDLAVVLNQAARELLLLQASDWPFLVTTGQAREYAIERFNGHVERFHRLADLAETGQTGPRARALAQEYFALDNVFPEIDYRVFKNRERKA